MSILISTLEGHKENLHSVHLLTERLSLIPFDKKGNTFSKHK